MVNNYLMKPLINKSQIRNVNFGKNCKVIEPVNLYGCSFENNVFIGPFVEIQKNVKSKKRERGKKYYGKRKNK